jgi:hypothetical protein
MKLILPVILYLFVSIISQNAQAKFDDATLCGLIRVQEEKSVTTLLDLYEAKKNYAIIKSLNEKSIVLENLKNKIKSYTHTLDNQIEIYASTVKMAGDKCLISDVRNTIQFR